MGQSLMGGSEVGVTSNRKQEGMAPSRSAVATVFHRPAPTPARCSKPTTALAAAFIAIAITVQRLNADGRGKSLEDRRRGRSGVGCGAVPLLRLLEDGRLRGRKASYSARNLRSRAREGRLK